MKISFSKIQAPITLLAAAVALTLTLPNAATAQTRPVEIHDRINTPARSTPLGGADSPGASAPQSKQVALTLDACSGAFDEELLDFLIRNRIPATLFVTKKWLLKNPHGVAILKARLDLFDIEDHGENHIPAVIGQGRKVYGITGEPDLLHLRREVNQGALAIQQAFGVPSHWYRGATAEYDQEAADEIRHMGFKIAGFSVNADAGASLGQAQVLQRMRHVQGGDVIIAHMNKPKGQTYEGLAPGLIELLRRGLVFVRLDQVDLAEIR